MMSKSFLIIFAVLFVFASPTLFAENAFVGAKKCKSCHKKKKQGEQFKIWSKSNHAKAFKSLSKPKAKKLAQTVGVTGDPQKAKACLVCHTPAKYDSKGKIRPAKMFGKKFKMKDGVQCENCHNAGKKYWKKKVMKKITKEGGARKSATAKKVGLNAPDKKTCQHCHAAEVKIGGVVYKNPSFKDFDFEKRLKEIAHPVPN
ncbi:MAG: cytochrome C554 [Deltaproteobacteria bacterium]|jgi:hypothetical protein|nr:cytochrome C554 [Deltaproteobacteria bacterium]MBT4091819.1 cytochrome C554 [Deltaproteobacteria bacterium]MBT4266509.1 cytochrome C554 [Deltaproteobacteria bacterium]MBT4644022.1 cytochrome C554 [Deltaproteobacteria bacterium]MBT6504218.1 cytochrome C554 [Deltaproteobacteria bacterium]